MSIQIPNLHTSNRTEVRAEAKVAIASRQDGTHTGIFYVNGQLEFLPGLPYPSAIGLTIRVDLTDSVRATFNVDTVEQLDTMGRDNPTVFATGRCSARAIKAKGLRYWLMMADNKRDNDPVTADVVSFLIYDRDGKRVAYGTGPVITPSDVRIRTNGE